MSDKILLPFPWYGGKASHLGWLLPLIESTPHVTYVEPFGGSAAVLLNKRPSPVEVYNDLYGEVVNFFRVLRDEPQALIERLRLTPYSREEFREACLGEGGSAAERATRFFVKARQVRSGLGTTATPGRWSQTIEHSRRGMAGPVSRWLSSIDGLEEIAARLRVVEIEGLDALEILSRYDTPMTLFYLDPPYLMETRTGGEGYAHEMGEGAHLSLLECLRSLRGKAILSGYGSEVYSEHLPGWTEWEPLAKRSAATGDPDSADYRQEVVWSNFIPACRQATLWAGAAA